jgi:hypothetical protein
LTVTAATLRRIAAMSPEVMAEMLLILADQEAIEEERKAKQRERTRRSRDRNVTVTPLSHDSNVTSPLPPPKKVSPKPPSKNTPPLTPIPFSDENGACPDFFEDFWKAFPRRDGENPKKPARLKFEAACRKGADPQEIIAGARRLATKHPEPSVYVPQAVTWLNQERWTDHESTGPPSNVVKFWTVDEIMAQVEANGG